MQRVVTIKSGRKQMPVQGDGVSVRQGEGDPILTHAGDLDPEVGELGLHHGQKGYPVGDLTRFIERQGMSGDRIAEIVPNIRAGAGCLCNGLEALIWLGDKAHRVDPAHIRSGRSGR